MNSHCNEIDILSGLDPGIIAKIKSLAEEIRFAKESVIFRQGMAAEHFFTLIDGKVTLCLGRKGHVIYKVEHPGEAFGWSSMTGCMVYTATAVSVSETKAMRFNGHKLRALLQEQPEGALTFYQNLSRMLDNRLSQSYELLGTIVSDRSADEGDAGDNHDPFELL